ncbi:MAG: hypothetical protein AVDCRST_MAG04-2690, partial [uncultured Acetobacteraceae bacterium]
GPRLRPRSAHPHADAGRRHASLARRAAPGALPARTEPGARARHAVPRPARRRTRLGPGRHLRRVPRRGADRGADRPAALPGPRRGARRRGAGGRSAAGSARGALAGMAFAAGPAGLAPARDGAEQGDGGPGARVAGRVDGEPARARRACGGTAAVALPRRPVGTPGDVRVRRV